MLGEVRMVGVKLVSHINFDNEEVLAADMADNTIGILTRRWRGWSDPIPYNCVYVYNSTFDKLLYNYCTYPKDYGIKYIYDIISIHGDYYLPIHTRYDDFQVDHLYWNDSKNKFVWKAGVYLMDLVDHPIVGFDPPYLIACTEGECKVTASYNEFTDVINYEPGVHGVRPFPVVIDTEKGSWLVIPFPKYVIATVGRDRGPWHTLYNAEDDEEIIAMAKCGNGSILAISTNKEILLFSLNEFYETRPMLPIMRIPGSGFELTFDPDCKYIVAMNRDGSTIYELETGKQVAQVDGDVVRWRGNFIVASSKYSVKVYQFTPSP